MVYVATPSSDLRHGKCGPNLLLRAVRLTPCQLSFSSLRTMQTGHVFACVRGFPNLWEPPKYRSSSVLPVSDAISSVDNSRTNGVVRKP